MRRTVKSIKVGGILASWLLVWAAPGLLIAQATRESETRASVRQFVQEFYDWYAPRAQANGTPALALAQKSYSFDPELVSALREDTAAQAKSPGQISGLDFDPFLNSQDPGPHYETGSIFRRGGRYWVEVSRAGPRRPEGPDVTAELSKKRGRWVFMNFHYPGDKDLLGTLKFLRESRGTRRPGNSSEDAK